MRVLCCLDGTNSEQLKTWANLLAAEQPTTYGLLYVLDSEPRREIERTRERFLRKPDRLPGPVHEQMHQAEQSNAGVRSGPRIPVRKPWWDEELGLLVLGLLFLILSHLLCTSVLTL